MPKKNYIPDEGVDLEGINVVELLEGLLDLGLVGLDVDDEDEGVVLLHLLHGALGVQGVHDDLVLVKARLVGDRLARVLGGARDDESLGEVEGGAQANLAVLVGVGLHIIFSLDQRRAETKKTKKPPAMRQSRM